MDKGRQQALKDHHQKLRTGVFVHNILPKLRSYFTEGEYVYVESQPGNIAQVDKLLEILLAKENRYFDAFCYVLEHNGYQKWAQQLQASASGHRDEAKGRHTDVKSSKLMFSYIAGYVRLVLFLDCSQS